MKHLTNSRLRGVLLTSAFLLLLAPTNVRSQSLPPPERLLGSLGLAAFKEQVAALDFTLQDLEGREVRLSDHRGQVVFLAFWTTW